MVLFYTILVHIIEIVEGIIFLMLPSVFLNILGIILLIIKFGTIQQKQLWLTLTLPTDSMTKLKFISAQRI